MMEYAVYMSPTRQPKKREKKMRRAKKETIKTENIDSDSPYKYRNVMTMLVKIPKIITIMVIASNTTDSSQRRGKKRFFAS
jgi:hypothetical protein